MLSTYYVSPTGNDANAGTLISAPLKSIDKINTLDLEPGDQVLFQGASTFSAAVSASNLVTDPGLESQNFNNWTENFDATAGNTTITTDAHSGAAAINVAGVGTGGRGQNVTSSVKPNTQYLFSAYAKLTAPALAVGAGAILEGRYEIGPRVDPSRALPAPK